MNFFNKKPANDPVNIFWQEDSWRKKTALQMPLYDDPAALTGIEDSLKNYPPLVLAAEAAQLKNDITQAARGKSFILQGGDCAESFGAFNPEHIRGTFNTIMAMADILEQASSQPVTRIGRMAGQFAKPRSDAFETHGDIVLPSYRGDMINDAAFTVEARRADPARIMTAYHQSAATLNLLRGEAQRHRTGFYTAHEALHLPYEQALTRRENGDYYALSAHFLWIGDRTRQPDGAHVEFMRGIHNPIGIKCGPSLDAPELLTLIDTLNPRNEAGRITLISRMGVDGIGEKLPPLVRAVKDAGIDVLWCCDPMHGNTYRSKSGYKTRAFADISGEIRQFFDIHAAEGTQAGGVQLELAGQHVTECVGGACNITDAVLPTQYHSPCDPRLNAAQSLEIAHIIAACLATAERKAS